MSASDVRPPLVFACAVMLAVFVPYYLLTLDTRWPIPRDGTGLAVGRDFLNFWLYGVAAHGTAPERYYDWANHAAAIARVAGRDYPGQQWSYPPSLMLVAAPFAMLPYLPALACWTVIGGASMVAALRRWTRDPRLILIAAFAPAGVFGLVSGQVAWVSTAILLTGLHCRERRPVVAGVLFGLLTIKPQLGVLIPVLLLATRNWRAIAAAGATTLAIAGATALIWGGHAWGVWIGQGIAQQSTVLTDPQLIVAPYMPTVFINLRFAGAPIPLANGIQLILSVAAAAAVFLTFRRRPRTDDRRATAIFLTASFVATPYLMAYDALPMAIAAILHADAAGRGRRLATLVWLLPLLNMALIGVGIPGAAIIPLAWLGYLLVSDPDVAP